MNKKTTIQTMINFSDCPTMYKPSSTIQMGCDNMSLLQIRQLNSLMYCVLNKHAVNPLEIDLNYIQSNKDFFKYINYAVPYSTVKKYANFTSKNNPKFIDPLKDLFDKKVVFNIFGKDKNVDLEMEAPLFTYHNKNKTLERILENKREEYIFFSFNSFMDDLIRTKKQVGANIPLHNNFKFKHTLKLYELILDYWNNGKFYLGTQNIDKLAMVIGGTHYLNNISYSKWKQQCLNKAISEINEKTDFNININTEKRYSKEHRTISFSVSKKNLTKNFNKINLPKKQKELFLKIKTFIKNIQEDFSNVFIKIESGNFITLKSEIDSKDEIDSKSFIEDCLNTNELENIIFSVEDRNKINKKDIEEYKILFKNSIYLINSQYDKWELLDMEHKETHKIIVKFRDNISSGLNIEKIRLYFFNYENSKNKDKYILNYLANEDNTIPFGISRFSLADSILELEKHQISKIDFTIKLADAEKQKIYNYMLNAINVGIKTFDNDLNEVIINSKTFLNHINLIKQNLKDRKFNYFRFIESTSSHQELTNNISLPNFDIDEFIEVFKGVC